MVNFREVHQRLELNGSSTTAAIDFTGSGGNLNFATAETGSGQSGTLNITVDGATFYIPIYSGTGAGPYPM